MKKLVMTILSATLVLGCIGCSNQSTGTPATTDTTTTQTETVDYTKYEGEYQDSTSQRATMTCTANKDDNSLNMDITWSDSSNESEDWVLNAHLEDGKLVYTDCIKMHVTYDENGDPLMNVESENGSGFFEIQDGKLLWTGAADSNCQSCIFEK